MRLLPIGVPDEHVGDRVELNRAHSPRSICEAPLSGWAFSQPDNEINDRMPTVESSVHYERRDSGSACRVIEEIQGTVRNIDPKLDRLSETLVDVGVDTILTATADRVMSMILTDQSPRSTQETARAGLSEPGRHCVQRLGQILDMDLGFLVRNLVVDATG